MKNQLKVNWSEFLQNYWQKKPTILRQALPQFNDPITPEELAGLALEECIESRIVTNKNGKWDAKYGPFEHYEHLGESNWTLLVQAVDHWHDSAATLVDPFRVFPHWQFEDLMISYATPDAGVGPHIDNYDVFIIQGKGSRRWRVGDRNPNYKQFSAHAVLLHVEPYEPIIDEILNAGDILYIPIGFPHDGVSLEESLSYSVGFRAPTSQEMISRFADYILDQEPEGIFYQDPNMQLHDKPYQIQSYELEKLQQQICVLINDKNRFNDWFGRYITEPMHELNIIPVEPPYDFDLFLQQINDGLTLHRVPSIRIFQIEGKGYIHQELIDLPAESIALLCQKSQLTKEDLNDEQQLNVLFEFVNKGYWYFE